jgi:hypothetical protein
MNLVQDESAVVVWVEKKQIAVGVRDDFDAVARRRTPLHDLSFPVPTDRRGADDESGQDRSFNTDECLT